MRGWLFLSLAVLLVAILATFLLDPRAADLVPGGHEKKKKTKRRD